MAATQQVEPNIIADRCRRRVLWRLMPFLFVLYVIAYLDRVNVGFAALQMKSDLGFTDEVIGLGAGIFFIGYVALEIPGSILCEKWTARGWIARIMVSWGILAMFTGFIHTKTHFYLIRSLLGAAEAGFFPGIIVYISHWFRYQDRAKAVAFLMAGISVSNIVGSPMSGWLMGHVNWLGLSGWRWMFIIEGVPAVILGVVAFFYLTDWPHQAKWLPDDERVWLIGELEKEKLAKQAKHSLGILQALRHREVILLTLAYFCMVTAVYGLNFWLPSIIKKLSGSSIMNVSLISALPYCFGLASILLMGWHSDKTKERRWHTALAMMTTSLGLLLSVVAGNYTVLAVSMFCLAAAGTAGYLPGFWALPTSFLTGTAAAASIGLINSFGNLGGFVGPYVVGYLSKKTGGSYLGGILYLSASALVASMLILSLRATRGRSASDKL